MPCPNMAFFTDDETGENIPVVYSNPRSTRDSDCTCNSEYGFEGMAASLIGCIPCKSGYYHTNESCAVCPPGTFSSRITNTHDNYKCPPHDQPALVVDPTGAAVPHPVQIVDSTSILCKITRGPMSCTPCPRGRSRVGIATSIDECSQCWGWQWYDAVTDSCINCTGICATNTQYESQSCTDEHDRVCSHCDTDCARPGEYPASCPGYDETNPSFGCLRCNNLPEGGNARYTPRPANVSASGPKGCTWECLPGFYESRLPSGAGVCKACTVYNITTCPAGFKHTVCTTRSDSSCSQRCSDVDVSAYNANIGTSIPMSHAEYVPTEENGSPRLADSENSTQPNMGCAWRCNPMYTISSTLGGLITCRMLVVA